MASDTLPKKLEQKAKQLILKKEIPPAKMEIVRSLLKNKGLDHSEKYQTIIDLLKTCDNKTVDIIQSENPDNSQPVNGDRENPDNRSYTPTETSYYIISIYSKYRYLKIFKKRHLVHRNNRFGMGLRKRIIPSRKFLKIMEDVASFQEIIASKLSSILMAILRDESIENPETFNYLRIFRNWMMNTPLIKSNYDTIKWMERQHFDREFKNYIVNFYSFLKIDQEKKEEIILQVENTLRMMDEFKKEEAFPGEGDQSRRLREKTNLEKEKKIYEFILLMRSFLPASEKDETHLSKFLKQKYNIESLNELIFIITQALVYQRPFRKIELERYYSIEAPLVSNVNWDYSMDFLKKVGKDPETRRQRKIDEIKRELAPYETEAVLLELDDNGQNLLIKGVDLQWKHIDKRRSDPSEVYRDNFIIFLEAVMQYFKNTYLPLLDGTEIYFRDQSGKELSGQIFTPDYFSARLENSGIIMNEIHYFRTNYPTLSVSLSDVKKIMKQQIKSMDHVERIIRMIGNFFYETGRDIHNAYEAHRLWVYLSKKGGDQTVRAPLSRTHDDSELMEKGRPLPFYDCSFYSFNGAGLMASFIQGQSLISPDSMDGLIQKISAFCYQVASECHNEMILYDLDKRRELKRKIAELT